MKARATRSNYLNTSREGMDVSRRGLLAAAAGSLAMSIAGQGTAIARPTAKSRTDLGRPVRVSKERLNTLASKFYAVFNENNILTAGFPGKHSARFDVDLRRITTFTRIPETGERVKVSGLLAVPVGQRGSLPVLSWQHGTILSFD